MSHTFMHMWHQKNIFYILKLEMQWSLKIDSHPEASAEFLREKFTWEINLKAEVHACSRF